MSPRWDTALEHLARIVALPKSDDSGVEFPGNTIAWGVKNDPRIRKPSVDSKERGTSLSEQMSKMRLQEAPVKYRLVSNEWSSPPLKRYKAQIQGCRRSVVSRWQKEERWKKFSLHEQQSTQTPPLTSSTPVDVPARIKSCSSVCFSRGSRCRTSPVGRLGFCEYQTRRVLHDRALGVRRRSSKAVTGEYITIQQTV